MEQELDKLMQEEYERAYNGDPELPDQEDDDDDLMRQSVDLEMFEKKLTQQKRKQEYQNQQKAKQQFTSANAASSDDDSDEEDVKQIVQNIQVNSNKTKLDADSFYDEIISKGKQIKEQAGTMAKKPPTQNKVQQIAEQYARTRDVKEQQQDLILEEILKSNNEGLKEKKLKELLQRNRNLSMQYEKEKAMRIKLESQLNQMIKDHEEFLQYKESRYGAQNSNNNSDAVSVKSHTDSVYSSKTSKSNTLKENSVMNGGESEDWKDKFQKTDKKLQEFRVQNNHLKNELNKALRVITKEIGESTNIDKILLEENGWKGRAQQIEKLKSKVKDLQQKIGNMSHTSISSDMSGIGNMGLNVTSSSHRGNSLGGNQTASDRRKEQEEMKTQFDRIKQDNDLISSKLKAVTARKNILEKEIKDIKSEYDNNKKILFDKSENDNKYIAALKQEIDKLKKREPEVHNKVVYQRIYTNNTDEDNEKKLKASDDEMNKLRHDIKYMKNELEQKERMITELISDKIKSDKQSMQNKTSSSSNIAGEDANQKIKSLEEMIKALRREREDFYDSKLSDKESSKIIKELSLQNAKLRSKVDDLSQQASKK